MLGLPDIDELTDLVRDVVIGRYWPPHLQHDHEIEAQIHATAEKLKDCPLLDVDADFNSYGSGFASYVHVFCTKANRAATKRVGETDWIDGKRSIWEDLFHLRHLVPRNELGILVEAREAFWSLRTLKQLQMTRGSLNCEPYWKP